MAMSGKDRLREFYAEVASTGAVDRIDEFCTEGFVEHEIFAGFSPDREGVKQFFTALRTAFPDLRMEPQVVVEEGDRVMARFRMTGTHNGEFMGVPASGRHVEIEGYDEVIMVDGRMSDHWGAMDSLALMQQIGAVPVAAAA